MVCEQEKISYDDEGLGVIIKQTEGSVRDALNLLETVRFSHKTVTRGSIALLGRMDDQVLIALFASCSFWAIAETVLQLFNTYNGINMQLH